MQVCSSTPWHNFRLHSWPVFPAGCTFQTPFFKLGYLILRQQVVTNQDDNVLYIWHARNTSKLLPEQQMPPHSQSQLALLALCAENCTPNWWVRCPLWQDVHFMCSTLSNTHVCSLCLDKRMKVKVLTKWETSGNWVYWMFVCHTGYCSNYRSGWPIRLVFPMT